MEPIGLFELAARKAQWLSARQSAVASNIANVNTPGYSAIDVEPFEKALGQSKINLAVTNPGHISGPTGVTDFEMVEVGRPAFTKDGAPVRIEQELVRSNDIKREFELNTAIVKSFHRMMMMVSKT